MSKRKDMPILASFMKACSRPPEGKKGRADNPTAPYQEDA